MEDHLNALLGLSHRYGGDPTFCIAGGGNTSLKTEDRLLVKASGHALATLTAEGLVEMDCAKLGGVMATHWPADPDEREALFASKLMDGRVQPERGQRPSVETLIHDLIPRRFVVHSHATLVNAVTCSVGGADRCKQWFGDTVLWVPYCDPGVMLAQALVDALGNKDIGQGEPIIVFMENHGLIVAADSADALIDATDALIAELVERIGEVPGDVFGGRRYPDRSASLDDWQAVVANARPDASVVASADDAIAKLVGSTGGRDVALLGPLVPDQIVYCRSLPLWIDPVDITEGQELAYFASAFEAYEQQHATPPWVVLIAGCGMLGVRESEPLAQITCDAYVDAAKISQMAAQLGGVQALSQRDRAFIENWEVESYRRSVVQQQAENA